MSAEDTQRSHKLTQKVTFKKYPISRSSPRSFDKLSEYNWNSSRCIWAWTIDKRTNVRRLNVEGAGETPTSHLKGTRHTLMTNRDQYVLLVPPDGVSLRAIVFLPLPFDL